MKYITRALAVSGLVACFSLTAGAVVLTVLALIDIGAGLPLGIEE